MMAVIVTADLAYIYGDEFADECVATMVELYQPSVIYYNGCTYRKGKQMRWL